MSRTHARYPASSSSNVTILKAPQLQIGSTAGSLPLRVRTFPRLIKIIYDSVAVVVLAVVLVLVGISLARTGVDRSVRVVAVTARVTVRIAGRVSYAVGPGVTVVIGTGGDQWAGGALWSLWSLLAWRPRRSLGTSGSGTARRVEVERRRIAKVAETVAVRVELGRVGDIRAVVARVSMPVIIGV